jgi:hypothetical protein
METPVRNLVASVDLTSSDALLPLFECVVNSIISLKKTRKEVNKRIQIQIERGAYPSQTNIDNIKTIENIIVIDNGEGFSENNYNSFKEPLSMLNKEHGCKGVGRFTWLAAFEKAHIESVYDENGKWKYREFDFDIAKEVNTIRFEDTDKREQKTIVKLISCSNSIIKNSTAVSLEYISQEIMKHCLIYYLCGDLPRIEILEKDNDVFSDVSVINELYEKVSKERERPFGLKGKNFRVYITKTLKENNRKNNYIYYCANSRVVGNPKNIGKKYSLFSYPIQNNGLLYFLDIYVVSDFLNEKVYNTRNGFRIPQEHENCIFSTGDEEICFDDIEVQILEILQEEYQNHVKEAKERNAKEISEYITNNAPRYNSFLRNPEIFDSIPPNISDDKKEEFLYKISFNAKKKVDANLNKIIDKNEINEKTIGAIIQQIKEKTAYDSDSLADYMCRRRAIIDLFDKFLDADKQGKYKLEADIHNLIFPMGFEIDEVNYESHNLWLLDERFATYKFIASDKPITAVSQKKSSKEPDLMMFNNPISYGDTNTGEISSMVIFEFKRPGDVAHQKNKTDYRWEFSELIEKYFDDFLYTQDKKNYKGRQVIIKKHTPKFGYVILDVVPPLLEDYNKDKGWHRTPFDSFYKMIDGLNLHIEVTTFENLLRMSRKRHNPFFRKLFGE